MLNVNKLCHTIDSCVACILKVNGVLANPDDSTSRLSNAECRPAAPCTTPVIEQNTDLQGVKVGRQNSKKAAHKRQMFIIIFCVQMAIE